MFRGFNCLTLNRIITGNVLSRSSLLSARLNQGILIKYQPQQSFQTQNVKLRAQYVDVNTKVLKDVIIFKYDNPRFYRLLNFFAISQFIFWMYLAHFAFTTLKDAPPEVMDKEQLAELPFYKKINLGDNKFKNTITVFCFLIGYGILATSWMFTLRSIRYVVLRKGGESVSLVMYTPFGRNRIMEVPLRCISAQESRQSAKTTMPIKIQNKSFFYVLDMRGEFLNTRLFDHTIGLKRSLK